MKYKLKAIWLIIKGQPVGYHLTIKDADIPNCCLIECYLAGKLKLL